MATGVVSWSQTAATNATADSAVNMAEGMAPSAVNDSVRALMASVAKWRDDQAGSLLTGGTSTAYTLTTNQVFASLAAMSGQSIRVRFHTTNGAAATINVDGLGAKSIYVDNVAVAGILITNSVWDMVYDNSLPGWIIANLANSSYTPPGAIHPYGGTSAPIGWLLCDGSSVLRATYPALFAAIGTAFGSVDGTHFNIPDLTGRVIAGKESAGTRLTTAVSGVDGGTLGAVGGSQSHTLLTTQLPAHTPAGTVAITETAHTHGVSVRNDTASPVSSPAGAAVLANNSSGTSYSSAAGTSQNNTMNVAASTGITATFTGTAIGSSAAHNNVQPTIVLNYIIKT